MAEQLASAVRFLATSAGSGLSLENSPTLLHKAETLQPGSVHSSFLTAERPSWSTMMIENQSKNRTKTVSDEEEVRDGVPECGQGEGRHRHDTCGFWRTTAESQVQCSAVKCSHEDAFFIKQTSFTDPKGLQELGTVFALPQRGKFALRGPPEIFPRARNQMNSAYDVCCEEAIEEAVKFMSSVTAPL